MEPAAWLLSTSQSRLSRGRDQTSSRHERLSANNDRNHHEVVCSVKAFKIDLRFSSHLTQAAP